MYMTNVFLFRKESGTYLIPKSKLKKDTIKTSVCKNYRRIKECYPILK